MEEIWNGPSCSSSVASDVVWQRFVVLLARLIRRILCSGFSHIIRFLSCFAGRPPNMLYLSCDGKYLTGKCPCTRFICMLVHVFLTHFLIISMIRKDYHVLLRKQIQFFEANEEVRKDYGMNAE